MSALPLQRHGDAEWPECWLFYQRVAPEGTTCGELVTFDRGRLTYRCPRQGCKPFTREPGFENDEARAWVEEHRAHLP